MIQQARWLAQQFASLLGIKRSQVRFAKHHAIPGLTHTLRFELRPGGAECQVYGEGVGSPLFYAIDSIA